MYRNDASLDFANKRFVDYAFGFGNKNDNFWEGLETMHMLTSDGRRYQLKVDLTAANGSHYYALYDDFRIGPARNCTLHVGNYTGTAGDSLIGHNGHGFTTTDHDVDSNPGTNCATYLTWSWWFFDCYDSCLTCPNIFAAPWIHVRPCLGTLLRIVNHCEWQR